MIAENLKMICVDRDKKAEGTEVGDLNIEFVPTFIIYKNDEEVGRIIEEPKVTLEEDLKQILFKIKLTYLCLLKNNFRPIPCSPASILRRRNDKSGRSI